MMTEGETGLAGLARLRKRRDALQRRVQVGQAELDSLNAAIAAYEEQVNQLIRRTGLLAGLDVSPLTRAPGTRRRLRE